MNNRNVGMIAPLRDRWSSVWIDRSFRTQVLVTVPLLLVVLVFFKRFLDWVELRPGVVLPDPVLAHIQPADLTWVTFASIYVGLLLAIFSLAFHPRQLLAAIQAYLLMVLVRVGFMYLVPFEAPAGLIPLKDPFVEMFGSGVVLTKDLFFSGHTSTMFLLFLNARNRILKAAFLFFTVVVGVSVVWQHVHFVIDVLVGPAVAYCAYSAVGFVNREK